MSELKKPAALQFRHNNSDGFVAAYEKEEMDKYLSEADKVIAELEESHKKEVEQLLIEIVKLKDIDSKNRSAYYKDLAMMAKDVEHHKYKRCLAMYRYCSIKALYELDFKGNDVEWKWYSKWMHKWFKLAKKFKEAK